VLTASASANGVDRWASTGVRLHALRLRPLAWTAGLHARESEVRIVDRDPTTGDSEVKRLGGWLGVELRSAFPDRLLALTMTGERVDVERVEKGWSFGPLLRLSGAAVPDRPVGTPAELEAGWRFGAVD